MKSVSQAIEGMPVMSIAQPLRINNEQIASFVNAVFEQLKSIFPAWGNAWKTQDDIDNAKKTWIKAFAENGITTKRQVSLGLKACRSLKTDFIPSVGNFINLCRPIPENLGLPSVDIAFNKALQGGVLHPVIDATVKKVGSYDIRVGVPTDKSLFKRFEYYYSVMVARYANGEPLNDPIAKAITADSYKTPEEVAHEQSEKRVQEQIKTQGITGGYQDFLKAREKVKSTREKQ